MKHLFILLFIYSNICFSQSIQLGKDRVDKLKASVVKIAFDKIPNTGTGFAISSDGLIITCFHVIAPGIVIDTIGKTFRIQDVYAEFTNGERIALGIYGWDNLAKYQDYDYVILAPKTKLNKPIGYLPLGTFEDIGEGDYVYTCGYPLGIKQQFISSGLLSTKWKEQLYTINIYNHDTIRYIRDVAWLDLTMNRGNSGGPIIKLGTTPNEDRVIGIATFILNPFAAYMDKHLTNPYNGGVEFSYNGFSSSEMFDNIASAISNNSIGISGCISINHLIFRK